MEKARFRLRFVLTEQHFFDESYKVAYQVVKNRIDEELIKLYFFENAKIILRKDK